MMVTACESIAEVYLRRNRNGGRVECFLSGMESALEMRVLKGNSLISGIGIAETVRIAGLCGPPA